MKEKNVSQVSDLQTNDNKIIEETTRLSESKLWSLQRNYFKTMGINAWKEDVPYYVTNNAFIGHQYATLLSQLFRDLIEKETAKKKFYILELGCGTGKFGYYFIKNFLPLLETLKNSVSFCYVMSDVSEKNVDFCQNNSSLKPFVEAGVLDFAIFDAELDNDVSMLLSGKKYSEIEGAQLIIISNYIFDCLKHDFLTFKEDDYYGLSVELKSRYKTFNQVEVEHLDDLRFNFSDALVNVDEYYEDPKLIKCLNNYRSAFKGKTALVPVPLAAINFVNNMVSLTSGNVFFLMGDKGVAVLENFTKLSEQYRMTYEGCYTFLLNFHLLGEYIKQLNGDALITEKSNDFQVCLYAVGDVFKTLSHTRQAFYETVEGMGPHEFMAIYDATLQNGYRYSPKMISGFLRLSRWDPDAYAIIHDRLYEITNTLTITDGLNIHSDIKKIEDNIYDLGIDFDVSNLLGLLYERGGNEEKALEFYKRSIEIFKSNEAGTYNLARIFENRKDKEKALLYYQKALEINPKNSYIKRKVDALNGKVVPTLIQPIIRLSIVISVIVAIVYVLSK